MTGWRGIFCDCDRTDEGVFSKTISRETAAQKDKRDGKGYKKYVSSDGGDLFQKHFYTKGKIPPGSHPVWVLFHLLYGLLNRYTCISDYFGRRQFYLTEQQTEFWYPDFLYRRRRRGRTYKYPGGAAF